MATNDEPGNGQSGDQSRGIIGKLASSALSGSHSNKPSSGGIGGIASSLLNSGSTNNHNSGSHGLVSQAGKLAGKVLGKKPGSSGSSCGSGSDGNSSSGFLNGLIGSHGSHSQSQGYGYSTAPNSSGSYADQAPPTQYHPPLQQPQNPQHPQQFGQQECGEYNHNVPSQQAIHYQQPSPIQQQGAPYYGLPPQQCGDSMANHPYPPPIQGGYGGPPSHMQDQPSYVHPESQAFPPPPHQNAYAPQSQYGQYQSAPPQPHPSQPLFELPTEYSNPGSTASGGNVPKPEWR